jgi:hypothetical protein
MWIGSGCGDAERNRRKQREQEGGAERHEYRKVEDLVVRRSPASIMCLLAVLSQKV